MRKLILFALLLLLGCRSGYSPRTMGCPTDVIKGNKFQKRINNHYQYFERAQN